MRSQCAWVGVGLAYVGTVVGAGFASGQEIWQFFSRFGPWGTAGLALAGVLFWVLGAAALERGRLGTAHFGLFLSEAYGRLSPVFEWVTALFLVVGLGIVAAGGGSALHSLLPAVPSPWGGVAVLGLILISAMAGPQALIRINLLVVPYLACLVLWVAWAHRGSAAYRVSEPHGWWFSALLYVSYNLFTGMTALLALGPGLPNRRASWRAAGLGAVVLTVVAWLEHRVLLGLPVVDALPMLDAASSVGGPYRMLYAASLLGAMFTTGLGEAFAWISRYGRVRGQWLWSAALLIGWPFPTLVAAIYPALGVVSVAFWLPLLWHMRRD